MKPRSPIQILRCLDLGGYSARMVGGGIETRGPRPLAEPLVADIKANRDHIAALLEEWCGGVWPPAREPVSGLREVMEVLDCGLAFALDVLETAQKRAA